MRPVPAPAPLPCRAAPLPRAAALLIALAAAACTPAGGAGDTADAGSSTCAAAADCPARACATAACGDRLCQYAPADEMQACTAGPSGGFCRAGACATDVRRTRALAVVTDFADRRLEDYQGPGFASEADIRAALDGMERHWWRTSLGTHRATWDLVRVTLPQAFGAQAFPDWTAFRDAAALALRATVRASDYDADGDGVIDAAYFLLAAGTASPDWAVGGMSRHQRVNVFVDVQDSQSVRARAIGNFNHEFGHCLGLPDLYGPYGTIGWLSFMADSWPVPPMGLSAFDRWKLGWMEPRVLAQTTAGVELRLADEAFSAVRIPGPRSESFLVEYRRRPAEGYGSLAPPHDGLVIYHLLEGSSQGLDPPLLQVESASGRLVPDSAPVAADLWSPGDPPFVGRSRVTGEEVFRLQNLEEIADGRRFDVVLAAPGTLPANLLRNGSFEDGAPGGGPGALPDGWTTTAWQGEPGTFAREAVAGRDGAFAARLHSDVPNDAAFEQAVVGLVPGAPHLLCGWLSGEELVDHDGAGLGANVSLSGTWTVASAPFGTFDWTQRCVAFAPDSGSVTAAFRLGFYGSTVTGTARGDAFTLEPLQTVFR
jgi:hypothetical protein